MEPGNTALLDGFVGYAQRLAEVLSRVIWIYAIALGIFLTVIVFAQVIMRYVFGSGLPWVNELSQYVAIWMFLPLAAVLIADDEHIRINVFVRRLSSEMVYRITLAELVVLLVFGAVFTYAGTIYTLQSGFASVSPSLSVDMFWFYVVLPISGALFCFFTVVRLLEVVVQKEPEQLTDSDVTVDGA